MHSSSRVLLAGASLFAFAIGCTPSAQPKASNFTITVDASHVIVSPDKSVTVSSGEVQIFLVVPDSGYLTSSTVGGTCPAGSWSSDTRYTTGAITADCTVSFSATAVVPLTFTVTPSGDDHESISPPGGQTVNSGGVASFTVNASDGWLLSATVAGTCPTGSWSGAVYTTGAITANCSVSFSATDIPPVTYTVTPSGDGHGTFTPSTPQTVNSGEMLSFTFTPENGYRRSGVVGTCPPGIWGGDTYTTGAITADCTLTFATVRITHTVTASGDGVVTLTPSTPQTVNEGATQSFTVTAAGQVLAPVGGTCPAGPWTDDIYTTGTITADCTVTFSVAPEIEVTGSSADGWESVTLTSEPSFASGTATFEVSPITGFNVSTVVTGTCPVGTWTDGIYTTGTTISDCTVQFHAVPAVSGLVAYYRGSGVDLSGYGHDAVAHGNVQTTEDRFGHAGLAAGFDGDNGTYLQVSLNSELPTGAAPRTISAWIRTANAFSSLAGSVLNYGTSANGPGQRFGLLVLNSAPYFVGQAVDLSGATAVDDEEWHHVAVTYDGTTITIWVDGQSNASAAKGLNTVGQTLVIGQTAFDHTGEPFTGLIDEVSVYDRVLSGNEIGSLSGAARYIVTPSADLDQLSVSPASGQVVALGAAASFTVTANSGWLLSETVGGNCPGGAWAGNVYTTGNITEDCSISFSATRIIHVATASGNTGETIIPSALQTVDEGDPASFTVTAASGWMLSSVDGDCPPGAWNDDVYTTGPITRNCTVIFNSTRITHTVTASGNTGEIVTPSTPQTVNDGDPMSFVVTAASGWLLSTTIGGTCPRGFWEGDVYTTDEITEDCTVIFNSTRITHTVTVSGNEGATFAPSTPQTVNHGDAQSFTVAATSGWTLFRVDGTCPIGFWADDVYTTDAITEDCTVIFIARPITHTVTPSGDGAETFTPPTAQTVNEGDPLSFVVTAQEGWILSSVVGGTCPPGSWTDEVYRTGAVMGDCTVSFSAVEAIHVTGASADGWETVQLTSSLFAETGEATFEVTAANGFNVSTVVTGTCPVGSWTDGVYTTGTITADCTAQFYAVPSIPSLVAYYRGAGLDLSGYGHNATVQGNVQAVTDRFGHDGLAASFDGADGTYLSVPTSELPMGNAARTVSAWVRTSNAFSPIGGSVLNYGTNSNGQRFGLLVLSGVPYFVGQFADLPGTMGVSNDSWHHLAVTYDGATITLWVDGQIDVLQAKSLNTVGQNLVIGQTVVGHTSEAFQGSLDEVSVYARALSSAEIYALFRAGNQ